MFRKPYLFVFAVIALVSLACGVNANVPVQQVTTGESLTEDVTIPLPEDTEETTNLRLSFGAGDIELASGAEDALLAGTARFNVEDFRPVYSIDGNEASIEQGDLNIEGLPHFDNDIENEWSFQLASIPLKLVINAGAYQARYELGGLSLTELEINDGAAEVRLSFDELNLVEMDTFTYNTGASDVNMENLANANFEKMIFRGGAGSYTLDFSGELQQDATVSIEGGISSIEIIVPEGVSAVLTFEGGLSNVDPHGDWEKDGNTYTNPGEGPTLTITVKMGAGNLDLRNR